MEARSAHLDREVRASSVAVLRANCRIEKLVPAVESKYERTTDGSQVDTYFGEGGFIL